MNGTDGKRVALVTGGARGIGFAVCEHLARDGHRVAIVDVSNDPEAAAARLEQSGLSAGAFHCDVSDEEQVRRLFHDVTASLGGVDVLVNNAAITPKHNGRSLPLADTPLEEWRRVLDVNLTGAFLMCRAAIPHMRQAAWGRIINVTSLAGRTRSYVSGAHYSASKAGMIGMSRMLAGELGQSGITVNCVAPGRIATPLMTAIDPGLNQAYIEQIPVRRAGTSEEIAAAVAYLASDGAGFTTGTTLDVNGGYFMA